jgi:hypothetical protein
MFEISNQRHSISAENADAAYENVRREFCHAPPQMSDGDNQKIFLSPGTAQSRFAPPSYYYLASKSGVTPSWVIAEHHRTRSLNLNS